MLADERTGCSKISYDWYVNGLGVKDLAFFRVCVRASKRRRDGDGAHSVYLWETRDQASK